MIERGEYDGRPCYFAYLTLDLQPTGREGAPVRRVLFDDGDTMTLVVSDKPPVPAAAP